MRRVGAVVVCIAAVIASVVVAEAQSAATNKPRVLVIAPSEVEAQSYSGFLNMVQEAGYDIRVSKADDAAPLTLYGWDEFDNLILLDSQSELTAKVTPDSILSFIDAGHNVILAASSQGWSDAFSTIAAECGVKLSENPHDLVFDHVHSLPLPASLQLDTHTLIEAKVTALLPPMQKAIPNIAYRGTCIDLEGKTTTSPLHTRVASSLATAYCADAHHSRAPIATANIAPQLMVALQARNNARVIISGSAELFSDAFFAMNVTGEDGLISQPAGNKELSSMLIDWTFQHTGVLRMNNVQIKKIGGVKDEELPANEDSDPMFTIKDVIEYSVDIQEWDNIQQQWVPTDRDDVQLEVTMLNPYIRLTLKPDHGTHKAQFTLPDVYGLFTLKIDYRRPGYSWMEANDHISVRPFRHNQYERFISSANPFYFASFCMIGGVVLFSLIFLFTNPHKQ
ncbi:dolichyl-di-phosphooligosaccharide-protein glycotransferase [Pelomyxa schiedti]|nr:dolichyl-di-phosphooligosaccharide-protein glycotransferase [Pelomyxa schiedti]